MYHLQKTFIKAGMKMAEMINENPLLLLMMEHFELDFSVGNKTIAQLCTEENISPDIFLAISNLYNGFTPESIEDFHPRDILSLIRFLRNSHLYYTKDIYPEIQGLIQQLYLHNPSEEVRLIEKFFNEYFGEVVEHLEYEDKVAFPYFCGLIPPYKKENAASDSFSVKEYRDHHSDIESKLADLKNLLLKHIRLKNDLPLRRKLLSSLFSLEYDLNIHSLIEESILIPLIESIERTETDG